MVVRKFAMWLLGYVVPSYLSRGGNLNLVGIVWPGLVRTAKIHLPCQFLLPRLVFGISVLPLPIPSLLVGIVIYLTAPLVRSLSLDRSFFLICCLLTGRLPMFFLLFRMGLHL